MILISLFLLILVLRGGSACPLPGLMGLDAVVAASVPSPLARLTCSRLLLEMSLEFSLRLLLAVAVAVLLLLRVEVAVAGLLLVRGVLPKVAPCRPLGGTEY